MMYYIVIVDDYQVAEIAFPATVKGRKRLSDLAAYLRVWGTNPTLFFCNEVLL